MIPELVSAENYWICLSQLISFPEEVQMLKLNLEIHNSSCLASFHPFLHDGRITDWWTYWKLQDVIIYINLHPIILNGNHVLTRLIIRAEHLRLLHESCVAVSTLFHAARL